MDDISERRYPPGLVRGDAFALDLGTALEDLPPTMVDTLVIPKETEPTGKFIIFSILPKEIRNLVWFMAALQMLAPSVQIFDASHYGALTYVKSFGGADLSAYRYRGLVAACKESRYAVASYLRNLPDSDLVKVNVSMRRFNQRNGRICIPKNIGHVSDVNAYNRSIVTIMAHDMLVIRPLPKQYVGGISLAIGSNIPRRVGVLYSKDITTHSPYCNCTEYMRRGYWMEDLSPSDVHTWCESRVICEVFKAIEAYREAMRLFPHTSESFFAMSGAHATPDMEVNILDMVNRYSDSNVEDGPTKASYNLGPLAFKLIKSDSRTPLSSLALAVEVDFPVHVAPIVRVNVFGIVEGSF